MNLNARMKEIDARLSEIRKMTNDESDVEKLTNYEKECDSLQEERKSIQAKLSIMDKTNIKPVTVEKNSQDKEMLEKRGIDLKEKRTIVIIHCIYYFCNISYFLHNFILIKHLKKIQIRAFSALSQILTTQKMKNTGTIFITLVGKVNHSL